MTDPTRVWLLRHAESAHNAAGVLSSRLPGADLTATGRAQAAAAAERLSGEPVAAVYSSPAARAAQTASAIGACVARPVILDAALVEADLGVWEDSTDSALCVDVLASWIRDRDLTARMPGGENGHEVAARFAAAMDRVVTAHPGGTVVVVSHVATITVGLIGLGADLGREPVWGRPLANAAPLLATAETVAGTALAASVDVRRWHAPWPVQGHPSIG